MREPLYPDPETAFVIRAADVNTWIYHGRKAYAETALEDVAELANNLKPGMERIQAHTRLLNLRIAVGAMPDDVAHFPIPGPAHIRPTFDNDGDPA